MKPTTRILTSFAFCLFALACNRSHKPVGDSSCAKITLGSDVIATSTRGGGIAGTFEKTTFYADGRVVQSEGWGEKPKSSLVATLSAARMQKLDGALAKVLVKAKQGCWSSPPHPDGAFAAVAFQHDAVTYQISADDMSDPTGLQDAMKLLGEVEQEARELAPKSGETK